MAQKFSMCARIVIFVSTINFALVLLVFAYYFADLRLHFFPDNAPVVETFNGKLEGIIQKSRGGKEYVAYLGIPYAQPPIEDLRFQPPLLSKNWDGIRPANKYGSPCFQYAALTTARVFGDENCLFLNVFSSSLNGTKPVMVWFHGGAFLEGSGNMYSPKYIMDNDIVIVTVNYRLAALGFLNTGDELISGNMGLKDQTMALRWVQKNIGNFGGDPSRVTIFGESAGGASVHYHIISPLSKGLFAKAIIQSGVVQSAWALTRNASHQAKHFAKIMGCPTENSQQMVDCLKKKNAEELVAGKHAEKFSSVVIQDDFFVGSMEAVATKDSFLTQYPQDIFKSGEFAKVPLMIGVVAGEGGLKTSRVVAMSEGPNLDDKWFSYAPILFHYDPSRTDVSEKIRQFYFSNQNYRDNPAEFLKNFTVMMGDAMFFHATVTAAKIHAQKAPVYLYYYDYRAFTPSTYSILRSIKPDTWILSELKFAMSIFVDMTKKYILKSEDSPDEYGPCHSDDLIQAWFLNPLVEIRNWNPDLEFSQKFIKALVDFAYDETNLKVDNVPWTPVNRSEPFQYMYLAEECKIIAEPFSERMTFLDSLGLWDPYDTISW